MVRLDAMLFGFFSSARAQTGFADICCVLQVMFYSFSFFNCLSYIGCYVGLHALSWNSYTEFKEHGGISFSCIFLLRKHFQAFFSKYLYLPCIFCHDFFFMKAFFHDFFPNIFFIPFFHAYFPMHFFMHFFIPFIYTLIFLMQFSSLPFFSMCFFACFSCIFFMYFSSWIFFMYFLFHAFFPCIFSSCNFFMQ